MPPKRKKESKETKKKEKKPKKEQDPIIKTMNAIQKDWTKLDNTLSGGSTNSIGVASLIKLMELTNIDSKSSIFVDFGSGAGIPCIYVALKYGIKCYGLELLDGAVKKATENAKYAGVSELCTFLQMDLDDLNEDWGKDMNITHFYSFDTVFNYKALASLSKWQLKCTTLNQIIGNLQPEKVNTECIGKKNCRMTGGSCRNFYVWNVVK